MPDVDETEVDIDPAEVRVDVYRSSGPGGQGVNTTDSAVRLTHLPTGIVASCQNERSQLQNKAEAMRMLRAKVAALAAQQAADENDRMRRDQVRTVDRSARVRTYNFPENRLTVSTRWWIGGEVGNQRSTSSVMPGSVAFGWRSGQECLYPAWRPSWWPNSLSRRLDDW